MNNIDQYKFGIIAYHKDHPDKIVHLCLYEQPPSMNDVKELTLELQHDKDFGIGERIFEIVLRDATDEEMKSLHRIEFVRIEDLPA